VVGGQPVKSSITSLIKRQLDLFKGMRQNSSEEERTGWFSSPHDMCLRELIHRLGEMGPEDVGSPYLAFGFFVSVRLSHSLSLARAKIQDLQENVESLKSSSRVF
jgi:hypothetical protein